MCTLVCAWKTADKTIPKQGPHSADSKLTDKMCLSSVTAAGLIITHAHIIIDHNTVQI